MIDVNKYKLDDDDSNDDSLLKSQTFKGKVNENKNNIDNIYNNFYKRNDLEIIEKRNFNSGLNNSDLYKDGNNKYNQNNNYKYLVDDSTSKIINNENDTEFNNRNVINNQNKNNLLILSTHEENFNYSIENDKFKFNNEETNEIKKASKLKNINRVNSNIEQNSDKFNLQISDKNQSNYNENNNIFQKNKNKKELNDKSLDLQAFKNSNDDDDDFFNKNANFHHVQIIDEDVENFKRKIDILVKNFKTDSIKDFMAIKRHLLIEQKNAIESEKQKCDAVVGAKTDQIEHLKENLEYTKNTLNKQLEIKEKFSSHFYKFKTNKKNYDLKKTIFETIKKHYIRKKINQRNTNKIRGLIMKHLKERGFKLLDNNRIENKFFNTILAKENEFKNKLNEMGQFYGKEISDLKAKLTEANNSIEKYKENKIYLQENLKRALMRGVVAMNLEAMNILEPEGEKTNSVVLNMANNMVDLNYFNKMTFNDIPNSNNVNNNVNTYINDNNINNSIDSPKKFGSEKQDFLYNSKIENQNNSNINSNYQPELLEKKNVIKDNKWINACSVPDKMKNNIIGNEIEEFEEKNIPIKVPLSTNNPNRAPIRNNIENNFITEASPIDITDELTKNFKNLVKTPALNSNYHNNVSYSNLIQNTDNSHNLNYGNFPNGPSNNIRITNNLNNTSDYSNANQNLFRNNNYEFNNKSFEENNTSPYNIPNNVLIKSPNFNQNGIVLNVKNSIQNQGNPDDNIFKNNFATNNNSNIASNINNTYSTQPNSNNRRANVNTSSSSAQNINNNTVNYNANEKNKISKKPSTGKIEKNQSSSKINNHNTNKNEIAKKK